MYIYRQSIFFIYLAITAVLVISDQLSKSYIASNYIYLHPVEINSWLNFTWINNSGAAFSLLSDMGGWQRWFLSTISFLASIYIIIYLAITEKESKIITNSTHFNFSRRCRQLNRQSVFRTRHRLYFCSL